MNDEVERTYKDAFQEYVILHALICPTIDILYDMI